MTRISVAQWNARCHQADEPQCCDPNLRLTIRDSNTEAELVDDAR